MDDEVIRRYEALSEHGKEIVVEAWAQIVDQAPERYLNDQTEWLINVIRDADAVASIGYFIVDLYASEGYSSALSAMWGGNSWLFAAVKAEGEYYGDTCYSGIELNCIVITASLPLPVSPGTHWVRSWHDAGYPPVIDRILFSRIIIDD